MNTILNFIATFFGVGRLPLAPGTWASLITTATLFTVSLWTPLSPGSRLLAAAAVCLLGIPAAGTAEKITGQKDPRQCVIDEVAGQITALLWLPHELVWYLAAFLLFRVFDIIKPFPIRRIEKIPGGTGIMLDDIAAGVYTLVLLRVLVWLV